MTQRVAWGNAALFGLCCAILTGCAAQEESVDRGLWNELLSPREGGFSKGAGRSRNSDPAAAPSLSRTRPTIIYGNDQLVGEPLPRQRGALTVNDGILLNFENAPLRDVVDTVLGSVLKANYTMDPRVNGQVTIQTISPLSREDAIASLETVLRQNGAAMVQMGDLINVLPINEAGAGARTAALAGGAVSLRPGLGVLIAPLRSASAPELAGLLQPLAGQQTLVQFDAQRNVLILSGNSQELNTLRETIQLFDVDWLDGLSYGLFPLQNADAEDVVAELQAVVGGPDSPVGRQTRIQTVGRLNAVLIVAKRRDTLEDLRGWVGRLDRKVNTNTQQVFVYHVENSRAADIADVLSEVIGSGNGSGGGSGVAPGADAVTLVSDGGAGVSSAVNLSFDNENSVSIAANDNNNSLVIRATPADYERLRSIIRRLDDVPLQVVLEATIAEVTLNNELSYGVQFFLERGSWTFTNSNAASGAVAGNFPGLAASFLRGDSQAILSAIDSVTSLNVISSPRLMVLDNGSARLQVGDEVPIITTQQQSTESTGNIINNVEFRETGVTLEISPRANSSGLVTLDILQETSNVVETAANGTLTPTISQRTIESSIAVQDGNTILLGGMIQESNSAGKSGVPLLSDAPVLGALFGTRNNARDRTELIVLLTPRVVRNPHDVRAATEEMRMRLQNMRPEFYPTSDFTRPIR